jgi:hypothetical protein
MLKYYANQSNGLIYVVDKKNDVVHFLRTEPIDVRNRWEVSLTSVEECNDDKFRSIAPEVVLFFIREEIEYDPEYFITEKYDSRKNK